MCPTHLFCICVWEAVGVLMLLPAFGRPEDNSRESVLSSLCNYMLFYLNVRAHMHTHTHILSYMLVNLTFFFFLGFGKNKRNSSLNLRRPGLVAPGVESKAQWV